MRNITQSEKETYLLSLSEDDFREKVVRRLFKRLGFADGRDLCGPEEQGKDTIFFEEDKFGGRALVSVQTKKGSVNLSADSTKNLHDIRAQIRTALESPFNCTLTKSQIFSSKVYLVASGKINQAARDWITKNISNEPRIYYLDRDDLIASLDKNCPEVWLNIAADVFPYLHALSKLVEDQALLGPTAGSIAGIKGYYAASDRAFIDLKLIKSVSTAKRVSGRITEEFKFEEGGISTLLKASGERLLLLGDAGSGKSTLLIRAAYLMAREGAAGKHDYRVPVVLRAGEISQDREVPILECMEKGINAMVGQVINAFTADDLEMGRVVLMVDGLDELPRDDRRVVAVEKINQFFSKFPRCSVVLATRPYSSIETIEGVRGFSRCRISPMGLAGAEKMVSSYLQGNTDPTHAKEILRRIDGIHGVELNPLLVTVFALTADQDRKDIPSNITELFSKFTELMLGRWDETKGVSQQFQARVKEHLMSQFAYHLHHERRTQFSLSEFEDFANKLLHSMNHDSNAALMIEEIVVRSGLLREVGSVLEFRHHLIQEYFSGRGIPGIDHIKQLVSDEWWRNSIVFYFGTNPDDVQSLLDVATSVTSGEGDACLTVGLALQTCYLSKLEDKIDVWKWVVETLSSVTERVLVEKNDEKFPILYFLTHYLLSRDAVALSGIERPGMQAIEWATLGNHCATDPELRRFWALVGLLELGQLELLSEQLKRTPLTNDHLNLALSLGCRLVEAVRSVKGIEKEAAKEIQRRLEGKVSVLRYSFAKEYRGQLLEYRRGGIVALDQEEVVDLDAVN